MDINDKRSADSGLLRKKAEELYKNNHPEKAVHLSDHEKDKLLHELHIRQIELELQNEELRRALKHRQGMGDDARAGAQSDSRLGDDTFSLAFEYAPIGIGLISVEARYLRINKAFTEMLGYTQEELAGMSSYDLIHPDDLDKGKDGARMLLEGTIAGYSREARYRHRDGHYVSVVLGVSMVRHNDGTPQFYILQVMDVTRRKEAEAALERAVEALRLQQTAVESAANAIVITDRKGNIVFVNHAFTVYTGYAPEDVIGRKPSILKSGRQSEQFYRHLWETVAAGKVWRGEIENRRKDGSLYMEDMMITPVRQANGEITHFIAIKQDITEQKKLQQELLQSQKVKSIGTLAAGVAHDFNNILNIILGYTTILEGKRLDERKFNDCIAIIIKSIERGSLLVQQILTFARKTDVSFEPIDSTAFVGEMISLLYETFPKTITLSKDFDGRMDFPLIMADRSQLHQALLNLCVNARDAMPHGGTIRFGLSVKPLEEVRRRFPSAAEKRYLCLEVIDTGEGMDKETRARIFDPFFTTKEKGKGTGLGLSVVYGIMQSHQGYVDVDSLLHSGTTFSLYFPVPEMNERTASSTADRERADEIPGGSEMIFVVEDEPSLMELVCAYLESKGYRYMTALDGEEAVELFAQHHQKISLVLSDIGLPKMDGLEVFQRMKAIDPGVRTVLASGFFEPGTKERLQQAGAKGFIQKPYKLDEVLRTIRLVLDA